MKRGVGISKMNKSTVRTRSRSRLVSCRQLLTHDDLWTVAVDFPWMESQLCPAGAEQNLRGEFGFICSGPSQLLSDYRLTGLTICHAALVRLPQPSIALALNRVPRAQKPLSISEENGLLEHKVSSPSKKGTTMMGMGCS